MEAQLLTPQKTHPKLSEQHPLSTLHSKQDTPSQDISLNDSPTTPPLNSTTNAKRWWTPAEDEQLRSVVTQFGARNWKRIAAHFTDRTDVQCLHRWQKVLNPSLVKGPWVSSGRVRVRRKTTWWCD